MEMVIDTLKYCDDLSDPAFAMYDVMKDAVEKRSSLSYGVLIMNNSKFTTVMDYRQTFTVNLDFEDVKKDSWKTWF